MNDDNVYATFSITKDELEACKSHTDLMDLVETYASCAAQTAVEVALQRYPNLAEAKNG